MISILESRKDRTSRVACGVMFMSLMALTMSCQTTPDDPSWSSPSEAPPSLSASREKPFETVGLEKVFDTDRAILARVGDTPVLADDLLPLFLIDAPAQVEAAVMNRVQAVIIRAEANRLGMRVSGVEVEGRISELIATQQARLREATGRDVSLDDYLRYQYDLDIDAYRRILSMRVRESFLLERLVRYEARQEDRRQYQVILVEDMELAETLVEKIRGGASFEILAKEHSTHVTKENGGKLPPLPVSFESPVTGGGNRLQAGEVSAPKEIRGPDQKSVYRILQLNAVLPASPGSWEDCSQAVLDGIRENPVDQVAELQSWEQKMMRRYEVQITPRDQLFRGTGGDS